MSKSATIIRNRLCISAALAALCAGMLFWVCSSDKSTQPTTAVKKTYTLETSVYPTGSGEVTVIPKKEKYEEGETVNVIADPKSGYKFQNWANRPDSLTNVIEITMTKNENLIAMFEESKEPPTTGPGTEPGTDPGTDPGTEPGTVPGT
jgi:hypothetical protein